MIKDMVESRKKDWFYDTKAGRIILLVLGVLVALLGAVQFVLFFFERSWYLLWMGLCSLFSGIGSLIVLNRKRKENARMENPNSNESEHD